MKTALFKYKYFLFIYVSLFFLSNAAWTNQDQQVDQAQDQKLLNEAVADTQAKMLDPSQRKKLINNSKAHQADQNAQATVGAENKDEIYAISAEILPLLMKQTGDTKSASEYLEKMQRDPAGFMQSLPPDIQEKIKALSRKVEKKESGLTKGTNP